MNKIIIVVVGILVGIMGTITFLAVQQTRSYGEQISALSARQGQIIQILVNEGIIQVDGQE